MTPFAVTTFLKMLLFSKDDSHTVDVDKSYKVFFGFLVRVVRIISSALGYYAEVAVMFFFYQKSGLNAKSSGLFTVSGPCSLRGNSSGTPWHRQSSVVWNCL